MISLFKTGGGSGGCGGGGGGGCGGGGVSVTVMLSTTVLVRRKTCVDHKSLLIDRKSLLIDCKSLLIDRKSLLIDRKSLLIDRKSLLIDRKSLLIDRKSLLIDRESLLIDCESLLIDHESSLIDRKSSLIDRKSSLIDRKSSLIDRKSLLIDRMSLLIDRKSLLIDSKSLLIDRKSLLIDRKSLLIDRKSLLIDRKSADKPTVDIDIISVLKTLFPQDKENFLVAPKPLNMLDLNKSLAKVAYSIAAYESFWRNYLGLTAQAINICLPEQTVEVKKVTDEKSVEFEESSKKSATKVDLKKSMSGREAVEYYTKCNYSRSQEHLYFNLAPSRHYRPYDLIPVQKYNVDDHRKPLSYLSESSKDVCEEYPSAECRRATTWVLRCRTDIPRSPEFLKTLAIQDQLMDEAITQLQKYVSNCSWLEHIYQFCKELEDDLVNLKTMSSETIQEKLSMLDMSKEAVSCCTSVTSTNRMIWLDCSGIHQFLVPWIDAIYQQITDFVINKRGENFVTLQKRMAEISKALLQKPGRLAEFVDYVQLYRKYLKDIPQCKDDMEYTEDLYNIISRYFREQTIDEFRENRALWKQWAEFQKQMSDVNSYVSAQTPWAISESDEKFKKLEICVTLLHQKAMGGKFLDPSNPASAMVDEIKEIRLEFQGNQESLLNLNKWKKAICGESYDLSFLNGMVTEMDARFDLWKYLRSTIEHTSEWKKMLFKKMNVNQTLQKIEEWKTAAQTLKSLLPFGDNVLKFWEQHLDNFIRPLPLLEIMSSPFLKSRHWQSMFDGMGAVYDVTKDYIVEELISLKLAKHEQTIMSIYRTAVAEHDLEIRVKKMKREWEQLRFKLFKYIPDSLKNTTRSELESSNESQIKPNFRSILSIRDDYYILTGVDELKMKLMTMLNSTILGEMQTEVEVLATTLHQIEEITHLWITAQNKWMYLIKVFEKPSIVKEFELHTNMFEFTVHNKFKDWMRAVNADPKVMSVCPKSMSEKDHRVLQGTKLRKMLLSIIETMDTILKRLQRLLDESRMDFPRLFFLSDNEVTDLLAVSDRPEQLVPSARKCFPGIFNLALRVPKQRNKKPSRMLTANELSMNTEKLEAFAIIGEMDELLPLASETLAPLQFNLQWFKDLEQTMKDTMVGALTDCVRFRFEEILDSQSPVDNKCFEWKICLKHQMDYKPVLRAEPEIDLTPELSLKANDKEVDLTRSKTVVKTAYEMSQCRVIQLTVSTPYGYEYLGPKSGLMFVHNPLTDRAMLSLTQSLKNYQCAAITGASSVGKTDTIKEFARLYGQCLFTICCSPLLTCIHIVQYLTGLLTSGCWALFDNVNRIPTDVMYLMSQHLDHIQSVLRDLQLVQNSQYAIRGQPKFDKKTDSLDGPLIRRNSLTTLHSLEKVVTSADTVAPVQRQRTVPHGYNLLLRPFSLIEPDYETIARTYLYICGFHTPNKMAQKIILFLKMFQTWQPPKVQFNTSNLSCLTKILSAVRVIVENENILLQKERQDLCSLMTDEEKIVMRSIVKVLRPSLIEGEETAQFVRTLRDVFRLSMPENDMKDAVLQEGLKDHLKETFSDFSQGMLDKLIELYSCCGQTNRSTILCGPSGSGKSTMLNALVHTLNMLSYQMSGLDPEEERRKQKSHGSPRFDVKSRKRLQLLRETIANFQPPLKIVDKLALMDGRQDSYVKNWTEFLQAKPEMLLNLLIMFRSLLDILKSAVSNLSMPERLNRQRKSREEVKRRDSLRSNKERLSISSLNFLPEEIIPFHQEKIKNLFVYAFIWGFGAALHEQDDERFSSHVRDLLNVTTYPISFPSYGSVFDHWVSESDGAFCSWSDQSPVKFRKPSSAYIMVPEIDRYSFVIDLMLDIRRPVLISGSAGIGKTDYVQNIIGTNLSMTTIRMSPIRNRMAILEELLLCEQRATEGGRVYMKNNRKESSAKSTTSTMQPAGISHLLFIDDLSAAQWENGCQPTLELLRQIMTEEEFYDKEQHSHCDVQYLNFIATVTSPTDLGTGLGHGTHILSKRLSNLFFNITFHTPTTNQLVSLYSQVFQVLLEEFPSTFLLHTYIPNLTKCLTESTIELYSRVKAKLKPTPEHPYYSFTLHDVAHIYNGLRSLTPRNASVLLKEMKKAEQSYICTSQQAHSTQDLQSTPSFTCPPLICIIIRLWIHECARSLADRILDPNGNGSWPQYLHSRSNKTFNPTNPLQVCCLCSEYEGYCRTLYDDLNALRKLALELLGKNWKILTGSVISGSTTTEVGGGGVSGGGSVGGDGGDGDVGSANDDDNDDDDDDDDDDEEEEEEEEEEDGSGGDSEAGSDIDNSDNWTVSSDRSHGSDSNHNSRNYNGSRQSDNGNTINDKVGNHSNRATVDCSNNAKPRYRDDDQLQSNNNATKGNIPSNVNVKISESPSIEKRIRVKSTDSKSKIRVKESKSKTRATLNAVVSKVRQDKSKFKMSKSKMDVGAHRPDYGCASKIRYTEQMARAIHKVHQQIRNSLHMMFILSSKGYKESVNSLHKHFEKYPALLTTSYSIMTNPSLSTKAYQEMITQWFEEDNTQQLFIKHVTNFEEHNTKIEVSTAALTYLHETSQTALRKQYLCKNGSFPYFPLQYVREMVYLFHKITDEVVEKETKKLLNFGGAVGKVNEAIGRIDGFKMTLNNLVPQYDKQMEHVRILASDIKQLRQLYGEVNSEMKDCRNTLVDIDKEIVELNRMIDTMFAGLNPIFQAAVATLQSINKKAWQEVKSYRQPPEPIKEVLKAVCLLFQCPQNWEDGQVLLVDSNFINNLIYYDKEQITDEMFARLKGYLSNPSFTSKTMMQYSLAAVSILEWLKAIYRYCRAKQLSAPYKEMVEKLKEKQIQIKERLGELHGISSLYRVQLKEDLQGYRLVMKRAKELDGQIQVIQTKVSEASHLVGNISEQHHMWQSEVSKSKMNLRTAFGDGMLAAASVSYLGAFDDQTRSKLQEEWIQHFDQPSFESSSPEILHPETRSVSVDALPSRRLSTSLSRLRSTPNMYNASPSTSVSVPTTSQEAMPPRRQVTFSIQKYNPMMEGNEFVYGKNVINEKDDNDYDEMDDKMSSRCDNEPFLLVRSAFCLRSVLSNYQELNDWKMNMNINDSRAIQNAIIMNTNLQHHRTFWPLLVDPDKQAEAWVRYLHINAPKPKATKPKKSGKGYNFKALPLQELNVIDLSLSNEAVMTKLMHATLKADRGDFEHQRLANEKDILQRRQEMFNEFALFREKTMNLEGPLIEDKNILESLLACNRKMEKNQQIITETCNSDDEQLKELCLPYAPMVKKAAIIYAAFEHLPKMNECYFISFEMFLKIFVAALRRCDRGFSAQEMNLRANELSVVTTTAIFEHLTRMMFEQHLLLFYLLVVLETFNLSGAATTEEIGVFLYEFNSEDLEAIEDALPDKPGWISKEGWLKCFLLEKSIDVFSDLLEYLTADQADKKWPEYFKQQCCAVPKKFPGPTPPVHWSLLDMAAMVDLAKPFLPLSNISIINKLTALFSSAYAGQCTTIYEVDHIQAVIKDILTVFYLTNQHVPKTEETSKESVDIFMETTSDSQTEVPLYQSSLMPSLVSAMIKAIIEGFGSETPSIRRFIHSPYLQDTIANSNGITDVVCQLFGMPASARGNLVCHLSRLLMDQISRITYWEDCHIVRRRCQAGAFHESLDELIERLSDVLSTCPGVEPADVTTLYCLYPDENLIKLEMQSFVEMQQQMEKHLAILRKFINKELRKREQSIKDTNTVVIDNVSLCEARWHDKNLEFIQEDFESKFADSDMYPKRYTLKLRFRESKKTEPKNVYHCPLIISSRSPSLMHANVVANIPLRTAKEHLMFSGKGVYMRVVL
ncbi:Hypothetical predicted protein [Octopus vulgaris]|uniref:AAA+ ATPase domain-containing protein n=1 Tax=Octopus vulgaris TaxID=6645 RepID=A0AA36BX36_OCTVU|nr:Hypothetical predicted protein [Octopus vulgaris]